MNAVTNAALCYNSSKLAVLHQKDGKFEFPAERKLLETDNNQDVT